MVFGFTDRSRYTKIFSEDVPYEVALRIPRIIQQATEEAFRKDAELLPGVRRDMFPLYRRAYVETGVHHLSSRFAVSTQEKPNKAGNYSHVELVAGRVVIVPAAVESQDDKPRQAAYRDSLAENPQMALPGFEQLSDGIGDALLAVVLYGPSSYYPRSRDEARPGFVVVRFPYADWSNFAPGRIDLLSHLAIAQRKERLPRDIALWPEEQAM
ncbi:MAG: hypothetical protein HW388_872 [Dehalococcoidia bacterium]|nr:hypothetical protein [Dehalococcoidia bacterium]